MELCKKKEPRRTLFSLLLDSVPIERNTYAQDCAAKFEFVGSFKLSRSIHLDTLSGVVNLRTSPTFLCGVVFETLDDYNLVNIDISQALVGILNVLTFLAVLVVGVLDPKDLRIVGTISILRYTNLTLAATSVGKIFADDVVALSLIL